MNTAKIWLTIGTSFVFLVGVSVYLYYYHTSLFINRLLYADLAAVEKMVDSGANIQQTKHGMGALHILAKIKSFRSKDAKFSKIDYTEYSKVAKYLIGRGLDINSVDKKGNTPLHYALSFSNFEMATVLIEAGANLSQRNSNGYSPLHLAIQSHSPIDMIKILLLKGADVNIKDLDGSTPLHEAVINGDMSVIEILIDYGADITAKDYMGDTPLDLAIAFKKKDAIEFLQRK